MLKVVTADSKALQHVSLHVKLVLDQAANLMRSVMPVLICFLILT